VKTILKTALILFVVCGLAAGLLAFVNLGTKDRIAAFAKEEQEAAMKQVFPQADSFTELPPRPGAAEVQDWDAVKAGAVVGSVHIEKPMGYSGEIQVMFGVDSSGALTGIRVLSHTETPGLGAKITTAGFDDQFAGKHVEQVVLKKDSPSGAIDAISAATISSRAVTRAVHDGMAAAESAGGQ
jgi:electron transport complex protein RnfG